jgi:dipeptidyl-peptidase III
MLVPSRVTRFVAQSRVAGHRYLPLLIPAATPQRGLLPVPFRKMSSSLANPAAKPELAPYLATKDTPVAQLEAKAPFKTLTAQETAYAAALYGACWDGYKVTLIQSSPESPALFELLRLAVSCGSSALRSAALASGISEENFDLWLVYAAHVFENCGNYRSFGDSKIIPSIPSDVFEKVLFASPAIKGASLELAKELWSAVGKDIYDDAPRKLQLGMAPSGTTTYYSSNFTEEDGQFIARFVKSKGLLQPYNTRVFKVAAGSYVIRLASSIKQQEPAGAGHASGVISKTPYDSVEHLLLGEHEFEGKKISIVRGDYAPIMARVVGGLAAAQSHAANRHQVAMLSKYIDSFRSGSQEAHIDGSRDWVRDVGPAVESYQGFIESYRDPLGVRGEWEGFVAVVNKEQSAKFGQLVSEAESLLPLLPWGKKFERDHFVRPDFSSLEVLSFGGSGVPAGINIPNYSEVREAPGGTGGFKNVSVCTLQK